MLNALHDVLASPDGIPIGTPIALLFIAATLIFLPGILGG
jgi:hypothetical protein